MPELPDLEVYVDRLRHLAGGQTLCRVRVAHPFLLRTADPPLDALAGLPLQGLERLGKRLVFVFPDDLFLLLHLMISGRLHWLDPDCLIPRRVGLAALDFAHGSLLLTERTTQKRAALHLVRGRPALADFDRGGLEPVDASLEAFAAVMRSENHTLKRALTDPRLLSGIGNAYSDEILHRARLSPVTLTSSLGDEEMARLHRATGAVLREWTERLLAEVGDGFPEKVTAFHPAMAVHGRFNQPCPICGAPVQRIRYATRETNYCPTCQTGGRLLADRSLSRLLKKDWPRSLEELEERRGR